MNGIYIYRITVSINRLCYGIDANFFSINLVIVKLVMFTKNLH